jgi:thioredoxin-dependent peroxiredoxin
MRTLTSTVIAVLLGLGSSSAAEMPEKGAPFPEWTLSDHRGNAVSSSDVAGSSYVLWFYPKAMTPGCTAEGNAFRDRHPSFAERGVKVFGVSFDTPGENAKFADEQNFPFALLSDEKKELGNAVGATRPLIGYARRISFLVGPDGRILESYEEVDPATHADQVLRDIDAASGK